MEVRLLNKDEKSLELELRGENETLVNLLKERLLASDEVETATYLTGHPLLDQPKVHVEVKRGKPEQAIKKAAKELRESLDEFETQFLRGLTS